MRHHGPCQKSDNGHVIVSMFFDASKRSSGFGDEAEFKDMCEDRKAMGYNSGMGEIFRRVAAINPVEIRPALASPSRQSVKTLRAMATALSVDTRGVTEKSELVALVGQAQKAKLRRMGVKQLRAEAVRLGLDLRGITERTELVHLLQSALSAGTSTAEGAADGDSATEGSGGPAVKAPPHERLSRARIATLSSGELREEATRRGLD